MRLYWEIGKRAFQRQLAYRTANLAGLVTNIFFGYVRAAVLLAAFEGSGAAAVAGYDAAGIVTFTWVTQAFLMVINLWGGMGVSETIQTGAVVSDLSKPFSYLGYWLARTLGQSAFFFLFRCVPIVFVGHLMFGLRWPQLPETWLALVVSGLLAILVSFSWNFLIELTGFWVVKTAGVRQFALGIVIFFSGFAIPIPLFPEWLQAIAHALPFAAITQIPVDLFLERHTGLDVIAALATQLFWAGLMLCAAQAMVSLATRHVVTQGG
ncbi:MAG TPA: ABC-2 family transporter protein [Chloroflexota bacterium]|nr:ABC-2 family transporter protein [Chloroflexota bacterium]